MFLVDRIELEDHAHVLKFDDIVTQTYVEHYVNQISISRFVTGSAQPKLNQQNLNKIIVSIPPDATQNIIVNTIEEERKIVGGNKKLIEIYSKKIEDRINKIWGD